MQNAIAIGCFVVLLLVGIPFAIKYPWRAALVVAFFAAHVAVMVGYAALIGWLMESQRPAVRRVMAAHTALSGLLGSDPPYDGPRHKAARAAVQTVVFVAGFAFYIWLLLSLGVLLDWLEDTPKG